MLYSCRRLRENMVSARSTYKRDGVDVTDPVMAVRRSRSAVSFLEAAAVGEGTIAVGTGGGLTVVEGGATEAASAGLSAAA